MTEEVREFLDKPQRSIEAAKLLFSDGHYDFAAGRAYYAMFYALEALMLNKGLSFSKHSALIAAFGKAFIKSGLFDSRFHRAVLHALDLRNAGDYGTVRKIAEEQVSRAIVEAGELLEEIKRHLATT
jgi:uncharacterized protein (UPF0332 family)